MDGKKNEQAYLAVLHKDADSDFGVSFPDFPGCVTAGSTLEEAHRLAKEALALHVEGMIEDGEEIPEPRSLDKAVEDPGLLDGIPFLVTISLPKPRGRSVRINVTIPRHTLEVADDYARKAGLSRSALLARAVSTYVKEHPERPAEIG